MSLVVPPFRTEQTDSHVLLHVDVPDCPPGCTPRAVVDEGIFGVSCSHAHLPLVFDKEQLVNAQGHFDESTGSEGQKILLKRLGDVLTVSLPKAEHAKHVHGLDTLKATLFPSISTGDAQMDEEHRLAGLSLLQKGMDAVYQTGDDGQGGDDEEEDALTENLHAALPSTPKVSHNTKTRMHELFAEQVPASHLGRLAHAVHKEEDKWDEGMYLDSFIDEDGEIAHLTQAELPALKIDAAPRSTKRGKRLDVNEVERRDVHLLLMELLFAHAYDRRTTLGEPTVESSWTIGTLCRSLVASVMPSSAAEDTCKSVLQACLRRQLCYGLYRNWSLSAKVTNDVVQLLASKAEVHVCVEQTRQLFDQGDDEALPIYNTSIVEPLLHHFDALFDSHSLMDLSIELRQTADMLSKSDVGPDWDLEALEAAAKESVERGDGGYV